MMKALCIYGSKFSENVGTLARSAFIYGFDAIYTIGSRYKRMRTDTVNAGKHIPIMALADFDALYLVAQKNNASVVMVELDPCSVHLHHYDHPENAIYVVGAENRGIPTKVLDKHLDEYGGVVIEIPTPKDQSMNVAVAGTIVMYDRYAKELLENKGEKR
jgi:tRNA G18 (ribose-2'-O)-methylase SpoU